MQACVLYIYNDFRLPAIDCVQDFDQFFSGQG